MDSTISQSNKDIELRVLDPNFPFLASEVAVDVDNILSGASIDQNAMHILSKRLLYSIEKDPMSGHLIPKMDIATLTVLGEAFSEALNKEPSKKMNDLLAKANHIATVLANEDLQNNREELEQARDFCVALSRAAAAYHESIRDLRPSHPFRR